MPQKFLKKIIAQTPEDLRIISALCSESLINQIDIKYLKENKVFLLPLTRKLREIESSNEKIQSIIKFDYIENSKSKNINHKKSKKILKLLTINLFKKKNNFEISLLFSDNAVIILETEIVEVTLEDIKQLND